MAIQFNELFIMVAFILVYFGIEAWGQRISARFPTKMYIEVKPISGFVRNIPVGSWRKLILANKGDKNFIGASSQ
jgi:hypothetical protein